MDNSPLPFPNSVSKSVLQEVFAVKGREKVSTIIDVGCGTNSEFGQYCLNNGFDHYHAIDTGYRQNRCGNDINVALSVIRGLVRNGIESHRVSFEDTPATRPYARVADVVHLRSLLNVLPSWEAAVTALEMAVIHATKVVVLIDYDWSDPENFEATKGPNYQLVKTFESLAKRFLAYKGVNTAMGAHHCMLIDDLLVKMSAKNGQPINGFGVNRRQFRRGIGDYSDELRFLASLILEDLQVRPECSIVKELRLWLKAVEGKPLFFVPTPIWATTLYKY